MQKPVMRGDHVVSSKRDCAAQRRILPKLWPLLAESFVEDLKVAGSSNCAAARQSIRRKGPGHPRCSSRCPDPRATSAVCSATLLSRS
eukprot:scaffold7682_cov315-Pinguiococcus_pyrenoidosus.AAC.2